MKNEDVVIMEEQTFIKKHSKKIIFGTLVLSGASIYYLLKKHGIEIDKLNIDMSNAKNVIKKITDREESRIIFEIQTLEQYIRDLNPEIKINKFVNIPNAEERIVDLQMQLKQVRIDRSII